MGKDADGVLRQGVCIESEAGPSCVTSRTCHLRSATNRQQDNQGNRRCFPGQTVLVRYARGPNGLIAAELKPNNALGPSSHCTPDSTRSAIARAVKGGWEKKASNPPQPRIARPGGCEAAEYVCLFAKSRVLHA
jgi:hypothetical protein